MKRVIALVMAVSSATLVALPPDQDKAFVDKYKTAYEAGDKATLESFLYTKDANPTALTFYKAMQADGAGKTRITKIELVDLTPEDIARASEVQTGPDGTKAHFSIRPAKKLNITIAGTAGKENTMSIYVAEMDGKYVIPVPASVK